jgi:hypothetical protein
MPTNQFFKNFNSLPQQELLNDLSREVIQINGIDVLYLERIAGNKDDILNEDASSRFTKSREVEMYINTPEGFQGAGDVVSKFGLDVQDELVLIVNKQRFTDEVFNAAPREGDLIYFPLGKGLYEIKFVEHEKPFYTLGKNTVYEITCELFRYSNEIFDIPKIEQGAIFDKIERENSTTIELKMSGDAPYVLSELVFQGPSPAAPTATAKVSSQNGTTLNLYRISGTFVAGENVTGNDSNNILNVISVDDQVSSSTEYDDNKIFETDGDNILDFSEVDPWSEGDL